MRVVHLFVIVVFSLLIPGLPARAQNAPRLERWLGIGTHQKPAPPLAPLQGLQDHVSNGKLVLSLDDAIRLALANNTDVRLDHSQIDLAQNNLGRAQSPFDPVATSSFADIRAKSLTTSTLQGASILRDLTQTTQLGYKETFLTGTSFQTAFNAIKSSTDSSFNTVNPALSTNVQFTVSQPLLRNFGLFPNRAPILIAQRNLKQARANFTAQVKNVILGIIADYWSVVLARENLSVQQKSLDEAQKSYDHDKKALSLGALPPLVIYHSESQVASRRVGLIQAEYSLKQAADQFRRDIGADLDPAVRVLDLELTDQPAPLGDLPATDIATALSRALTNRPEFETVRQQLASDELSVRLAHSNLKPDLELSGFYSGNGLNNSLAGLDIGLSGSLDQTFHFTYPTYGASLLLTLPVRRHSAQANLADALIGRRQDQYQERRTTQSLTLEVTNAVHALEEAKLSMEAAKVAGKIPPGSLHPPRPTKQFGAGTGFFFLDAQTQLAQAELNLIQAQISFQLAVAQVDHATGDLLEHHHVEIVEPSK